MAQKAIKVLETGFDDATAVLMRPEKSSKRLCTTNAMDRLIEKVDQRPPLFRYGLV